MSSLFVSPIVRFFVQSTSPFSLPSFLSSSFTFRDEMMLRKKVKGSSRCMCVYKLRFPFFLPEQKVTHLYHTHPSTHPRITFRVTHPPICLFQVTTHSPVSSEYLSFSPIRPSTVYLSYPLICLFQLSIYSPVTLSLLNSTCSSTVLTHHVILSLSTTHFLTYTSLSHPPFTLSATDPLTCFFLSPTRPFVSLSSESHLSHSATARYRAPSNHVPYASILIIARRTLITLCFR